MALRQMSRSEINRTPPQHVPGLQIAQPDSVFRPNDLFAQTRRIFKYNLKTPQQDGGNRSRSTGLKLDSERQPGSLPARRLRRWRDPPSSTSPYWLRKESHLLLTIGRRGGCNALGDFWNRVHHRRGRVQAAPAR